MTFKRSSEIRPLYSNNGKHMPAQDCVELLYTQCDALDDKMSTAIADGALYINVKTYGAKGDGSTDDTTSITDAINYATSLNKSNTIVYLPPGTYKLTTSLPAIDANKISVVGNGSILDFPTLTSGYAITVYSTATYDTSWSNIQPALKGLYIKGGGLTSRISANGIFIGSNTYSYVSNITIQDVSIEGFARNLEFGNNAWRVKFVNFNSRWGKIYAPTGLTNMGENISFTRCMFADGIYATGTNGDIDLGYGTFQFTHCSFDNVPIILTGESMVFTNQCHFENPGNGLAYRYASVDSNNSSLVIDNCVIVCGEYAFNKALFYVADTNIYQGITFSNVKLFQNSKYRPVTTDGNALLVAGNGRVEFLGGMKSWMNYNGYVIAKSLNKIYNGNAETGNTNGWIVAGTVTADTTQKVSGTYSTMLTALTGATSSISQDIDVNPGKWALIQIKWMGTLHSTTSNATIQVFAYSKTSAVISSNIGYVQNVSTFSWQTNVTTQIVPVGTSYIKVKVSLVSGTGGTSYVWVDDVIVNII